MTRRVTILMAVLFQMFAGGARADELCGWEDEQLVCIPDGNEWTPIDPFGLDQTSMYQAGSTNNTVPAPPPDNSRIPIPTPVPGDYRGHYPVQSRQTVQSRVADTASRSGRETPDPSYSNLSFFTDELGSQSTFIPENNVLFSTMANGATTVAQPPRTPVHTSTTFCGGDEVPGTDPVATNGALDVDHDDIDIAATGLHFRLGRHYNSSTNFQTPLGFGWNHSYNRRLIPARLSVESCASGNTDILYVDESMNNILLKWKSASVVTKALDGTETIVYSYEGTHHGGLLKLTRSVTTRSRCNTRRADHAWCHTEPECPNGSWCKQEADDYSGGHCTDGMTDPQACGQSPGTDEFQCPNACQGATPLCCGGVCAAACAGSPPPEYPLTRSELDDGSGIYAGFESHGLLASVHDAAGHSIRITWNGPTAPPGLSSAWGTLGGVITQVDLPMAAGSRLKTLYFNYDRVPGFDTHILDQYEDRTWFLHCIGTLPNDCGHQVLVKYNIQPTYFKTLPPGSTDPRRIEFDLTRVTDADSSTIDYSYSASEENGYVAGPEIYNTADVGRLCSYLCNSKTQNCHNQDLCAEEIDTRGHAVCDSMCWSGPFDGYPDPVQPSDKRKYCDGSRWAALSYCIYASGGHNDQRSCTDLATDNRPVWQVEGYPNPFPRDAPTEWQYFLGRTYQRCINEMITQPWAQYSNCRTDCFQACTAAHSPSYPTGGRNTNLFHNLTSIVNGENQHVLDVQYGGSPYQSGFDQVTQQVFGGRVSDGTVTFQYHNLDLELTDSAAVTTASHFYPVEICPRSCANYTTDYTSDPPREVCAEWADAYSPAVTHYGLVTPDQAPHSAIVMYGLYGVTTTSYYDVGGRLLREVNNGNGHRTDYNYSNGALIAVQDLSGRRQCLELDAFAKPTTITLLPAPGYPGNQNPQITTVSYEPGNHEVAVVKTNPAESGASTTTIMHDPRGRLSRRIQYVDGGAHDVGVLSAHYADDSAVAPDAQDRSDGSHDTAANFDGVTALPQLITVAATSSSPGTYYRRYDDFGRVNESGRTVPVISDPDHPHQSGTKLAFSDAGRLSSSSVVGPAQGGDPAHPGTAFTLPIVYTYDHAGRVVDEASDTRHRVFHLDASGNVVQVDDTDLKSGIPNPRVIGGVVYSTRTTCLNAGPDGRIMDVARPEGNRIHYLYDDDGNLTNVQQGYDPTPYAWAAGCVSAPQFGYDTASPPLRSHDTKSYTFTQGFLTASYEDGISSEYVRDGFGRVIDIAREYGYPGGPKAHRRLGYDDFGRVAWRALYDENAPPYYYPPWNDSLNPPSWAFGNGLQQMEWLQYDSLSRVVRGNRWKFFKPGTQPLLFEGVGSTVIEYSQSQVRVTDENGLVSEREYDGVGRVRRISTGIQTPSQTDEYRSYLDNGQLVGVLAVPALGPATSMFPYPHRFHTIGYVGSGAPSTIEDEDGSTLQSVDYDGHYNIIRVDHRGQASENRTYDGFDRLLTTYSDGAATSPIQNVWDMNDRLQVAVDRRGNRTYFGHDGLDRQTTLANGLGITAYGYATPLRLPTTVSLPDGASITRSHNSAGALLSETVIDGLGPTEGQWTGKSFGFGPDGQISSATIMGPSDWNTVTFERDSLGRLRRDDNSLHGAGVRWTYGVNCASGDTNCRDSMYTQWGSVLADVQEQYDSQGRIASTSVVSNSGVRTQILASFVSVGTSAVLYSATQGGPTKTTNYDKNGLPVSWQFTAPGQLPYGVQSALASDGIVRQKVTSWPAGTASSDLYEVDDLGRVKAENHLPHATELLTDPDNSQIVQLEEGSAPNRRYVLDAESNWSSTSGNMGSLAITFDSANRIQSTNQGDPQYSGNGVFLGLGQPVRSANSSGLTTAVLAPPLTSSDVGPPILRYSYDALGRRLEETDVNSNTATALVWDAGRPAAYGPAYPDLTGLKIIAHAFEGEPAALVNSGGGVEYLIAQPDGSIVGHATASGSLTEAYTYDAYGTPSVTDWGGTPIGGASGVSPAGNRVLFQGMLWNSTAQTYSTLYRDLDPVLGRWTAPDPIGLAGGTNLFSFVGGRPLAFADVLGLCAGRLLHSMAYETNPAVSLGNDLRAMADPSLPMAYRALAHLHAAAAQAASSSGLWKYQDGLEQMLSESSSVQRAVADHDFSGAGTHYRAMMAGGQRMQEGSFEFASTAAAGLGAESEAVSLAEGEGALLFRGTTRGFPGNPALQQIGITPTSTDPLVATLFGIEASQSGDGVLLVAPRSTVPTGPGNVLSGLEAEVGVELTPSDFAARATEIGLNEARTALSQMGFEVPTSIPSKSALAEALRGSPRLSDAQIAEFARLLGL